jgi:hypothetical protein
MPIVAIIAFVICVVLFVLLTNILANRKQIKAAHAYGKQTFDIELPDNASTQRRAFHKLSDAEAFYVLVTPYVHNLSSEKQKALKAELDKLKQDLKISNDIYDTFDQKCKVNEE